MLNNVAMMGRCVANPEVRETNAGKKVCSFSIAVDRDFKNAEGRYDCDFFNVVFFEKQAEIIASHFKKGDRIIVHGRMQNRVYEKDGVRKQITELFGLGFNFVEKAEKKEFAEAQPAPQQAAPQANSQAATFGQPLPDDDKIPF